MFYLKIKARFAAYRPFVAGSFRPTAPFITLSAAYGLLLNLAGEDMRDNETESTTTLIRKKELPYFELAVGALNKDGEPHMPHVHSVYQQLHNYPVGTSGQEYAANTYGNKYNITPVIRSFLSCLQVVVACRNYTPENFHQKIENGLAGNGSQYGLPFMGDNNFLPDKIELLSQPDSEIFWFARIAEETGIKKNAGRLTTTIDRDNSTHTKSALFAPIETPTIAPPTHCWEMINYNH